MKPLNAGQAAAAALVDELWRCGVRRAFISPGSRSAPLVYALAASPIDVTVCLDERSAAFMAVGAAKVTRTPAVVACTSGTAGANLFPAVIEARMSAVPMIVLTADRPPELRETGAGQTIDQVKLFGSYPRWYFDPGVPEARSTTNALFRGVACRAFAEATGPPGGPVHINLQLRDPLTPEADADGFPFSAEGREDGRPWSWTPATATPPTKEAIEAVARHLKGHRTGLIVAGTTTASPDAIAALAHAIGWPLIAEPMSGARANAVSCAEALVRSPFADAHRPDAVIRIGSLTTSKALMAFIADAEQVLLDDVDGWHDPDRAATIVLRSDPTLTCTALSESVRPGDPQPAKAWSDAERKARDVVDATIDGFAEVSEPRVARDLAAAIPDGGLLVVASSMPVRDLDYFMAPRSGLSVASNRGANGIDGTLSTAIGAALTHDGPAFALMGDLAFLHDRNALLSPERPDLVVVVINNDGGGIFSFLPQAELEGFEPYFGTPHGTDIAQVCAAHGVAHSMLDAPDGLAAMVQKASGSVGVKVIEARTDRRANVDLHRQIWEAVSEAFSR